MTLVYFTDRDLGLNWSVNVFCHSRGSRPMKNTQDRHPIAFGNDF